MLPLGEFTPLARPASLEAEGTLPVSAAASIRAWVAASIRVPVDSDASWWQSCVESRSESAARGTEVIAVSRQSPQPLTWPSFVRRHCRRGRSLPLALVATSLIDFQFLRAIKTQILECPTGCGHGRLVSRTLFYATRRRLGSGAH
jgi:hypothetical protein